MAKINRDIVKPTAQPVSAIQQTVTKAIYPAVNGLYVLSIISQRLSATDERWWTYLGSSRFGHSQVLTDHKNNPNHWLA